MGGINRLTATKVKGRLAPGRHADGGNLYLNVTKSDARSWLFMFTRDGKRTELGLGPLASVPLAEARTKARACREALGRGDDPREIVRPDTGRVTVGEAVDRFLDNRAATFATQNPKTAHQWQRSLLVEAKALHRRDVATVKARDVASAIRTIWHDTPETGRRLRSRLEILFDYARAQGLRDAPNPAAWKGTLEPLLGGHGKRETKHHKALDWKALPAFMADLREREAMSAKALRFTILTAARTTEARAARWEEVDWQAKTWTVPAERMGKTKVEHTVPLSAAALGLLRELHDVRVSDYVFPGPSPRKPLGSAAMDRLLKHRMGVDATVHGFRSTFRDWAGDGEPGYPRELAEMALAHTVGGVEGSYRRGRAVERRRPMMEAWAAYCDGRAIAENVVAFRG